MFNNRSSNCRSSSGSRSSQSSRSGLGGSSLGSKPGVDPILRFFKQLQIGTVVTVQYDDQPVTTGTFEGIQDGLVLLSNFNGFPGVTRLNPRRINAVSVSA